MASLLKSQILKHLSKFTKNLSPDKINLSTLKGEGELSNLELDEKILMDLMDLPTWMCLTKAVCNKVSIKIQWTKLKSQPISLFLDEVVLEMETCNEPRPPNNPAHMASYRSGGKYGFADRVIDGIYVHINAVLVKFISRKFTASLQLSRVKVHSVSPNWQSTEDLRSTRIKDVGLREVLLFKEVDWQTTRIEANAADEEHATTPLRFIANQSKIRIAMKKSLNDCSILTSRVMLLLDDLLWVLTTTQLKAAILYINSMKEMIEKSAQQSKKMAADKLQKQGHADHGWVQQPQQQSRSRSQSNTASARIFTSYDILTTSYHLITSRIDLHLCDDSTPDPTASPKHNRQIEGGAMQITLFKLSMDYYPYHLAGGERKQWYRYSDNLGSRNSWVRKLFEDFKKEARETCCVPSPSQSPSHNPLNRKSPDKILHSDQSQQRTVADKSQSVPRLSPSHIPRQRTTKLMECCMVLKIEDFHIYCVSTADNKRNVPHKFLTSDKKQLHLPPDMSVIHMEYTDYFYTEGIDYPVPHSNLYMLVNPIRLTVDFLTLLWMNYFALNLSENIDISISDQPIEHIDIKVEVVMPRVIIPAEKKIDSQPDRPEGLQIQISRLSATNTRVEDGMLKTNLLETLQMYSEAHLFSSTDYPNDNACFVSIPKDFVEHARSLNNPYINKYAKSLVHGRLPDHLASEELDVIATLMKVNTLKLDSSHDVWGIGIDQLWLEFVGTPNCRSRPIPFFESFPLNLWFCKSRGKMNVDNIASSVHVSNAKSDSDRTKSNSSRIQSDKTMTKHLKKYRSFEEDSGHDPSSSVSDSFPDCNLIQNNNSSKPANCDNREPISGNVSVNEESGSHAQCTMCKLADFYVVAKFGSKIRAQLNHFQYLFLLRMIESFSEFQIQLNVDLEQYGGSIGSFSLVAPFIVPDIEFAIVCPYVPELLQMSTSNDLVSPGASSDKELEFDEIDHEMVPETDSCEVSNSDSNTSLSHTSTSISKSQSDSRIHFHNVDAMPSISQETLNLSSEETLQTSQSSDALSLSMVESVVGYRASDGNVLSHLVVGESGHSSEAKSKLTVKKMNRAADQMKKSFTSAMTSFTGRLKTKDHNEELLSVPDDFETMSIKTDISDDEDFEYLALEEEQPAFSHGGQLDALSSTGTDAQDDLSSLYAESSTATKGKDLVSVIIYHMKGTELMLESIGQDIVLRLQTSFLDNLETGNIDMEEFSNKFISSKAGFFCDDEVPQKESTHFPVKMKYLLGPAAELEATKGEERGFISVHVDSQKMEMKMSSTISLANFIEDEIIPDAIPMHITITDLDLTLQEDRPPINITSPGPVPIPLFIHKLVVSLGENGVFHIHGDSSALDLKDPMLSSVDTLQADIATSQNDSLVLGTEEESAKLLDVSISHASQLQALQAENAEFKKCLHELMQLKQKQEDKIENLMRSVHLVSDLRTENKQLAEQLHKFTKMSNGDVPQHNIAGSENMKDLLEDENLKLQQRVTRLEDDLNSAVEEKDSLIATLKLLQDELFASEQNHLRQRDHRRK